MQILASVRQLFPPATLRRLAAHIQESEGATARTLDYCVPTSLAAILRRTSTPSGAEEFLAVLNDTRRYAPLLGEIPAVLSSRHSASALIAVGQNAAARLLEWAAAPVAAAIAEECRVTQSAAEEALALVTLLMLDSIGKHAVEQEWDSVRLIEALSRERGVAARALPAEVARHIELYEAAEPPTLAERTVPRPAHAWANILRFLARA